MHISLGVIGTGLFLGTATSLAAGGPIGLLLGYMTVGSVCYSVMVRSVVHLNAGTPLKQVPFHRSHSER